MKKILNRNAFELVSIVTGCLLLLYLLFLRPLIGVADNGDFLRIMHSSGLNYLNPAADYKDQFFGFFHSKFSIQGTISVGYASSELLLVWAAVVINKIFFSLQVFDIRFLSIIYSILLIIAMSLFVKLHKKKNLYYNILIILGFFIVFFDIGYIAYFNSFFGEAVTYTSMLMTLIFAMFISKSESPKLYMLIVFFICALFFAWAKFQNAPIGLLLGIFGIRLIGLRSDRRWKVFTIVFTSILMLSSIIMLAAPNKEFKEINEYQTVFYGILKDSPDPGGDLEKLGINKELAVLANTNFFTPDTPIKQDSPQLKEEFYKHISHTKVAEYYLLHPARFVQKLQVAVRDAFIFRPFYLGNYEKSDGYAAGKTSSTFGVYGAFKQDSFPRSLLFWFIVTLGYCFMLFKHHRLAKGARSKVYVEVLFLNILLGIIGLVIPIIGDGEADLTKHLFLFNVSIDVMVISIVIYFINYLSRFSRR
jgi:hypothetical protein